MRVCARHALAAEARDDVGADGDAWNGVTDLGEELVVGLAAVAVVETDVGCMAHGACISDAWCMYVGCMLHVCCMYAACMVHIWRMYVACMFHVCFMCVACMAHVYPIDIADISLVEGLAAVHVVAYGTEQAARRYRSWAIDQAVEYWP